MAKDVKELRKRIVVIDQKIKELFLERMEVSKDILSYKKENNLPIVDEEGEKEDREKIFNDENIIIRKFYPQVNEALMKASKEYQEDLFNHEKIVPNTTKIAYFGIGHSNTYISLIKMFKNKGYEQVNDKTLFKDSEEVVLVETKTMDDLKTKLIRKEVNQVFVPFVNDEAGVVMDTYYLMKDTPVRFLDKFQDKIILYLYVAKRNREMIDNYLKVETIYSNLPAFNQCSDFINDEMPYATFRKSSSTTQAIKDMLNDNEHLAACFANEDALHNEDIVRLEDVTTSNNKGSTTKFLLLDLVDEKSKIIENRSDFREYFEGYYIYTSEKKEGKDFSVDAKSYRVVEIKRDDKGFLNMFIYTFGNKTKRISYSKNATTYVDALTKEICLMYEYESVDKSKNVNGVAFLRAREEDLKYPLMKIKGEYIGKDNGKSGTLCYRRISEEEFKLLLGD